MCFYKNRIVQHVLCNSEAQQAYSKTWLIENDLCYIVWIYSTECYSMLYPMMIFRHIIWTIFKSFIPLMDTSFRIPMLTFASNFDSMGFWPFFSAPFSVKFCMLRSLSIFDILTPLVNLIDWEYVELVVRKYEKLLPGLI